LPTSKSTGLDGLAAKFLKISADVVTETITYILNLSIQTKIYPNLFKTAKVTPIFKKGQKHDIANYRPISILPILSKILERHVSNNVKYYLNKHSLTHETQSGFRSHHSCETALTAILDDWINAVDENKITGTVFLDLSKAFDMIDHEILIEKLAIYKFNSPAIQWFKSYLHGRTQQVSISNTFSESQPITRGVPQGSVLGPLLFIIFINDMPLVSKNSQTNMFADDSTLYYSSISIDDVTDTLNQDLINVQEWCHNNSMVINTKKPNLCTLLHVQNSLFQNQPTTFK
jgi:hypothetical protein